jgi:Cytochrome c oxidase subunit VIa
MGRRPLAKTLTLVRPPAPILSTHLPTTLPANNDNSVVVPAIILGSINAKNLWDEHWEHWKHLPPLEERVEYPYQNIRTRNFCWGDGDKTLL